MGRKRKRGSAEHQLVKTVKTADLRHFVSSYFSKPRSYFVPYVYTNNVYYEKEQIAGLNVDITHPFMEDQGRGDPKYTQESQVRDDQRNFRVWRCLHKFASKHPHCFVVVSQLQFEDYLIRSDDATMPRPSTIADPKKRRGDFDLLIIGREFGLLLFEIKAIGDLFDSNWTDQKISTELLKKLRHATKQLQKGKEVLEHMVSDKQPQPRVLTTLVMPNITTQQLHEVLRNNSDEKSKLCQCLDSADPLNVCLCSDNLTNKEGVARNMSHWWEQRMVNKGPDPAMTDDIYFDLIGRFCGPATLAPRQFRTDGSREVYLHSMAEAVATIGERFSRYVLHKYQQEVLKNKPPLLYINGPPGTGKTTVLLMVACIWLEEGQHVHIISTCPSSLAATHLLTHQIAEEMRPSITDVEGRVHMHEFDMKESNEVDDFVTQILQAERNGQNLCIIADEAFCGSNFIDFCEKLITLNASAYLRLWAANVYHGYRPSCLPEVIFYESLRTPPLVTRQVSQSSLIQEGFVRPYKPSTTPAETDGPPMQKIAHGSPGHFGDLPKDCKQCGVEVVNLLSKLEVGQASCTPGLSYRDVFILTNYYVLEDELKDEDDNVERPACDFLQAMCDGGFPVRVVQTGDSAALKDVSSMSGPDAIIVADANTVRGLERKVVIYVQYDNTQETSEEGFARLDSMSRTTSQLILVT